MTKPCEEILPWEVNRPIVEIQTHPPKVDAHFHRAYELVLVKGSYGKRLVGTNGEDFCGRDLLLVGPGVIHGWMSEGLIGEHPTNLVLKFQESHLGIDLISRNEFASLRKMLKESSRALLFEDRIVDEMMSELLLIAKSGPGELMVRLILVLERLSRCAYRKILENHHVDEHPFVDFDIQRLAKILEYISKHSAEPISLQQISVDLNMSVPTFTRFFRRMVGCSFVAYLMKWRLDRARVLLCNGDDSILSISIKVGFNNLAHFNRQFKRRFGSSPRLYKVKLEILVQKDQ